MRIATFCVLGATACVALLSACQSTTTKVYNAEEVRSTDAVLRAHVIQVSTSSLDALAEEEGFSSLRHSYFVNDEGERRIVPSLKAILDKGPSWHVATDQEQVTVGRQSYALSGGSAEKPEALKIDVATRRWTDVTGNAGDTYSIRYSATIDTEAKDDVHCEGTAIMRAGKPYVRVISNNKSTTTLLFIEAGRHFYKWIDAPEPEPMPEPEPEPEPMPEPEPEPMPEPEPEPEPEPMPEPEVKELKVTKRHKLNIK